MPVYEYEATKKDGTRVRVEQIHRIRDYPRAVDIEVDGERLTARLVISRTAKMATNWAVRDTVSDLPPENSPIL